MLEEKKMTQPARRTPKTPSRAKKNQTQHPWIQLLDLEIVQPLPPPKKVRGRPPRRFPRTEKITFMLTPNELAALDSLVDLLKNRISRQTNRGDVIAFMAYRLRDALLDKSEGNELSIPEEVHSFMDLALYLDGQPEEAPVEEEPVKPTRRRKAG